jgi:shikimate dehydrogenase
MHDHTEISGATALLGILADPIAQVQTPRLVNELLRQRNQDAVLVPLHVGRDELLQVVAGLRAVRNFRGAVVTMPHKAAIMALLDEVTPEARQVGACNVFRRAPDGRLIGTIFDGEACVAGLRSAGHALAGKSVLLAGAGGAAAALAFAFARHAARRITIHNRTSARAEALAERVRAAFPQSDCVIGDRDPAGHLIVVNATSLGRRPGDALPIRVEGLQPGMLAVEIILAPAQTAFLAEALRRGCAIQPGRPMLEAQIVLIADFLLQ